MPKRRPSPKGKLAKLLDRAIRDRRTTPPQVAAAARVNKGTLYRILSGETSEPHISTLRKLCKVLELDIALLVGAEQLELLADELVESGVMTEMQRMVITRLREFTDQDLPRAAEVTVLAILEVKLGAGRGPQESFLDLLKGAGPSRARIEKVVLRQLAEVPAAIWPGAVQAALGALGDLEVILGADPALDSYRPLPRLRYRLWKGLDKAKRLGPRPKSTPNSKDFVPT